MKYEISKSDYTTKDDPLYSKIAKLIELTRQKVASVVNLTMDDEQQGKERAEYGKSILNDLSLHLTTRFGKGFSERNLQNMRQFFLVYKDRAIPQKASAELQTKDNKTDTILKKHSVKSYNFNLSWSHYLVLMRIENLSERRFYEIEALNQKWSEPQLKRQYNSSLYERLALSRDKNEVMKLANAGQVVEKPEDILKNPLSLEFLGLTERASYTESDMEHAIIDKLQHFFIGNWQRFSL